MLLIQRPRDVLQNHQKKNGRPRAPNNEHLLRLNDANPIRRPKSGADSSLDDEDGDPKKSKGPKYSKIRKEDIHASPTTLGFYETHWKALLRYAKAEMRFHCATVDLFTPLEVLLEGAAREILSQSLTKWKEEKRSLEDSTCRHLHPIIAHRAPA